MQGQPLVSICIPTYNRAEYLRQSLELYVQEPEVLDGRVEIVIGDNCSTDDTERMCREYAARYEHIHYYRNPENIRDRNFPTVMSRGSGELHRLINDTHQIFPGRLHELCVAVEKYRATKPFIYWLLVPREQPEREIVCNSLSDFISNLSFYITSIGGFTLWHEECIGLEHDTADCELSLWQVRKACDMITQKDVAVIFEKSYGIVPIIKKKDMSYGMYKVFHDNMLEIIGRYRGQSGLTQADLDELEKDLLFRFFSQFIIGDALGTNKNMIFAKDDDLATDILKNYENRPYYAEFCRYCAREIRKQRIKRCIKKAILWEHWGKNLFVQKMKTRLMKMF